MAVELYIVITNHNQDINKGKSDHEIFDAFENDFILSKEFFSKSIHEFGAKIQINIWLILKSQFVLSLEPKLTVLLRPNRNFGAKFQFFIKLYEIQEVQPYLC